MTKETGLRIVPFYGVDAVGTHTKELGKPAIVDLRKPITPKRMQELRKAKSSFELASALSKFSKFLGRVVFQR
ncbi:MAG: hypothetical protein A3H17_03605 [Candidatus Levybacteria bacterium RIFCSPLOWO2_12_FULL_37_14]|nr:MAG: hypothetical protein US43_C0022G0011 [Candidatus Levybacteria bacterium GW2011_GWA1_37_16]OGH49827.1 MAG: hypothetical protein A3H17_03605 [Candidatus Levybacteria bacterium RIFCSPLOWO2_12_FULL_37_14]